MSEKPESKSARLQELINRRDKVLAVLHPPTAARARIMEKAGCEALFVRKRKLLWDNAVRFYTRAPVS